VEYLRSPTIGPACRLFLVPSPGATCCRPIFLDSACGVSMGPAAHSGLAASFPCTGRHGLGKTKRKEAVCCPASFSREDLLEVEAITALKIVASKPPASGTCSPSESKQAVRLLLLPLLRAELEQIEPTNR
jgi:hypothetical protein